MQDWALLAPPHPNYIKVPHILFLNCIMQQCLLKSQLQLHTLVSTESDKLKSIPHNLGQWSSMYFKKVGFSLEENSIFQIESQYEVEYTEMGYI